MILRLMDAPKTRRESKKDPKQKAKGKSIYSAKHVRIQQTTKGSGKPHAV